MIKICFFVPPAHAEKVKSALFSAGAGTLGDYAQCSWETLGMGQFRPMAGSDPFIGSRDQLERVEELKVEILCQEQFISQALAALKDAHPYEEPAFELISLLDPESFLAGA